MKLTERPVLARVAPVAASAVVGVAFVLVVGGAPGVVAGVCIPGAFALYLLASLEPRTDAGVARVDGDALLLPRRAAAWLWLVPAHLSSAMAFAAIGAAAIEDPDYSGGYRGSAEVLVLLAPVFVLLAAWVAVGGLLGRNAVRLRRDHLEWRPTFGRRRTCPWVWPDQQVHLADDGGVLWVMGGGTGAKIDLHTQRWTGQTLLGLVRVLVASSAEHRAEVIAAGGLWPGEVPPPRRPSAAR